MKNQKTTTGAGNLSAVRDHQQCVAAIHNLDRILFGGQVCSELLGNEYRTGGDSAVHFSDELCEALRDLVRCPSSRSNAAKVYALRRNRARSGDLDFAFARLAAAYAIGSAPYLHPEAGAD